MHNRDFLRMLAQPQTRNDHPEPAGPREDARAVELGKPQFRDLNFQRSAIDQESRTVEIALSSEEPYERWYGIEILGHGPGEVDLSRLLNKAPLLLQHNHECQIGVIEDARLDADRVLRCTVRFSKSEDAEEVFQDVLDGIRSKVSVGYMLTDYECTKGKDGAPDTYRFTNWIPYEGSIVSVPADDTVGVGRSHGATEPPTSPAPPAGTVKESTMDPKQQIAAALAAGTITQAQADAMLRALENPDGERTGIVEALQLQAIASRHGVGKEAMEALAGKPIGEARAAILALIAEKSAQPLPGPGVDMSAKEAREYSYSRAIYNSVLRREGQRVERGFEDEISETIRQALPKGYEPKGGVFVPTQLRSGLDSATSTAGAELKYTEFGGELIELLRNSACVIRMGARMLPGLNGPVGFPRQTGAATVNWVAENSGSGVAASAPAFDTVTLTPKTMQGNIPFSRQLLQQSVLAVEPIVRAELAAGHALAFDKAALHGLGSSNQPTGIYRTTGVNAKAMGGVPTYGKLQDMITQVAVANALMNSLGWLTTPGMAGLLAQTLVASAAGSKMIWDGPYDGGMVNGYKGMATNQVSALMSTLVDTGGSSHGIIFGNWNDLLIGTWGALELLTDPYTLADQGMIKVTSFQMGDVEVRHPASFSVATGATLS